MARVPSTAAGALGALTLGAIVLPSPVGTEAATSLLWASRLSGAFAYLGFFGSVAIGLLVAWRGFSARLQQRTLVRLHNGLALATLLGTVLHIAATVALALWGERGLAIFAPAALAAGVLATAAVGVGYAGRWLTGRLQPAAWRVIHRITFLGFAMTLVHMALAGQGIIESHIRWLYLLSGSALLGASLFRFAFGTHSGSATASTSRRRAAATDFVGLVTTEVAIARHRGEEVLVILVEQLGGAAPSHPEGHGLDLSSVLVAAVGTRARAAERSGGGGVLLRRPLGGEEPSTILTRVGDALAASGSEWCVGVAVFPESAWDTEGLLHLAGMMLAADRFDRLARAS